MRVDPLTLRVWRYGVAAVIAFDAVQLVIRTRMRAPLAGSPLPGASVFRDLALSAPGLAAVALVAVLAALAFARGRRPILAGLVALAANRALLEAFGALDGIFDETTYHAGAAMLGWIAGLALWRLVRGRAIESTAAGGGGQSEEAESSASDIESTAARGGGQSEEILAGLCAAALFGATYLDAGISKLQNSGLSWADGDTIRLLVVAHRPVGVTTWLDQVRDLAGRSASISAAASLGTLVIQCGAFLFPWTRRTRLVWGALFLAFHTGIHLVAGSIFFVQAALLAALFGAPWHALGRRLGPLPEPAGAGDLGGADSAHALAGGGQREEGSPVPTRGVPEGESLSEGESRRLRWVVGAGIAVAVVVGSLPLRPRVHPVEAMHGPAPLLGSGEPEEAVIVERLGPLRTGMEIGDGWAVRTIGIEADRALLTVAKGTFEMVYVLDASPGAAKGPFEAGNLHVSYRPTSLDWSAYSEGGEALAGALEQAGGGDVAGALRGWVKDALHDR